MRSRRFALFLALAPAVLIPGSIFASRALMRDGRIIEGRMAPLSSVVDGPKGQNQAKIMVLVDDGLRRIYIPDSPQLESVNELDAGDPVERFDIAQQITENGAQVGAVGDIYNIGAFDEFGRRNVTIDTNLGAQAPIQGITEITPEWTKLECIDAEGMHFIWDMRVATSSIPRDDLAKILAKQVKKESLDQRLKIVRLYIQSERFKDAEAELQAVLADFPNLPANQKQVFEQTRVRLKQTSARRVLDEIETRRKAGQHALSFSLLKTFPTEKVAGETLQAVAGFIKEYEQANERGQLAKKRIDDLLKDIKDSSSRLRLLPIRDEIHAELSFNTLERMAAFLQFQGDDVLKSEEKLALAVSGWLAGTDFAVRNLTTALSMYDTRNLVAAYLAETASTEHVRLLGLLRKQEAFTPELIAKIIALMKPPLLLTNEQASKQVQGLFDVQIDYLPDRIPINYTVQLPQEYDPHRRYPVIMALHGAGMSPIRELEWWAGGVTADGRRFGQADRFGYIVIAPAWSKEQQVACTYSEDEHAAVLYTLRDAYRRLSIDTDRVFIAGHGMGGDAAWDIALAHPDLWAGFIGVSARALKTINYYQENAAYVPTYLVSGEMDRLLWNDNAVQMDRYFLLNYNFTAVQMKGRGREHFSDELLRLFDWMSRQKREPFPKQFNARSIRYFDGSFYWVETRDPPERGIVDPDNLPPRGYVPLHVGGKINATNGIDVTTGCSDVTVWLSPELVDFKRPCEVKIRNIRANKVGAYIEPDAAVILDDARTRSDRLHPFWAKIESKGK